MQLFLIKSWAQDPDGVLTRGRCLAELKRDNQYIRSFMPIAPMTFFKRRGIELTRRPNDTQHQRPL